MYRTGAQIIRKPPGLLHYLLSGLGSGITQGAQRATAERERKKSTTGQILESVLQGQIDPRMLNTPEGQAWLKNMGVYADPTMQDLIFKGQKMRGGLGKGDMGPPSPHDINQYYRNLITEQEDVARKKAKQKADQEIEMLRRRERVKRELAKESEETPGQQMERLLKLQKAAEGLGLDVEDISYKGINLRTPIEKADILKKAKEKEVKTWEEHKDKYNDAVVKATDYRTNAMKMLTSIKSGAAVDWEESSRMIMEMLGEKFNEKKEAQLKQMSPDERTEKLRIEFNKGIIARNTKIKELGRKARLRAGELKKFKLIGKDLGEEKESPEPIDGGENRNVITLPGRSKGQVEEEIEASQVPPEAITATNPTTGEKVAYINGKWVKIKE